MGIKSENTDKGKDEELEK